MMSKWLRYDKPRRIPTNMIRIIPLEPIKNVPLRKETHHHLKDSYTVSVFISINSNYDNTTNPIISSYIQ